MNQLYFVLPFYQHFLIIRPRLFKLFLEKRETGKTPLLSIDPDLDRLGTEIQLTNFFLKPFLVVYREILVKWGSERNFEILMSLF